jgi:hypothetical protein
MKYVYVGFKEAVLCWLRKLGAATDELLNNGLKSDGMLEVY